jgi:peptidoglycan-associated lipoprotein
MSPARFHLRILTVLLLAALTGCLAALTGCARDRGRMTADGRAMKLGKDYLPVAPEISDEERDRLAEQQDKSVPIGAVDTGEILAEGEREAEELAQALAALRAVESDGLPESTPVKQRPPQRLARRQVPELHVVYFDFNSYQLIRETRQQLEPMAEYLNRHAKLQVQIQGHTDERGTSEYNYNLGEQRAGQVREFFIERGVNPAMLFPVSFGEERPADDRANEEAWGKNRRVEFYVY